MAPEALLHCVCSHALVLQCATCCLLAGCSDNGLRIFEEVQSIDSDAASLDPSSFQQPSFKMFVHREQAHDFDVNCVRWHPKDPLLLASAGDDNSVKLWRYTPAAAEMNGLHNSSHTLTP